ncbi:MAG: hypothetical protein M0Q21_12930 [Ignavibacteriaceae bacterium]|nr:hypothetical protein [Ignavibacteriaceae bacterium]
MTSKIQNAILRKPAIAGFLLILLFFSKSMFAQTGWYFTSSVQLSGGKYVFDSYNRVYSVYSGMRYQGENFGITASIPLVTSNNKNGSQSSGMMVTSGTNNVSGTGISQNGINFGLGDLYGYFDYKIISDFENELDVYVNAQIKIPTAAAQMNIGTGKYDFGGSVSLRKSFDSFIGVVDLGYLNIGDPDGVTYKDPFTYGIGIGKFFNTGEYSLLLYYTGYTKIVDAYDSPQQLSLGVNYRTSETIILSVIGSAGKGNFAPDFTLSSGIRINL